jgi:uncharacterized protein (DUF1684 family)
MGQVRATILVVLALAVLGAIRQTDAYREEVEAFRAQRESEINSPTGWGALVGLHFLNHGTHSIGRDRSNDVVLNAASAPGHLGTISVGRRTAAVQVAAGLDARLGGSPARLAGLIPGRPAEDGLSIGTMTMVLLDRSGRLALRVWDEQAPILQNFRGLSWYDVDPAWRIDARFVPLDPAPLIPVLNVLDEVVQMRHVGVAEFTIDDQPIRLLALKESDDAEELFFMFRDASSGAGTYPAGRYLYTPLPSNRRVVVDFNKAKNPPCAFTEFATCPLPPSQNRLTVPIPAGERDYGVH